MPGLSGSELKVALRVLVFRRKGLISTLAELITHTKPAKQRPLVGLGLHFAEQFVRCVLLTLQDQGLKSLLLSTISLSVAFAWLPRVLAALFSLLLVSQTHILPKRLSEYQAKLTCR